MAFDRSRYVGISEQDLDEFTCDICREIFSDPVVTKCCRQTYCSDCIHQWLTQHNSCPNDRKPLRKSDISPAPRFAVNILNNLKVSCDYHMNGCQEIIATNELANHILNCDFRPNQKCKTCGFSIDRNTEHNCIENFKHRIDSISDENEKLRKENSELLKRNVCDSTLLQDLSMQTVIESARNNINNYVIERRAEKMSEKLLKLFVSECKRAILTNNSFKDICKSLSDKINEKDLKYYWNIIVYTRKVGHSLVYSLSDDCFCISFTNLRIEILLFRE